MPKGVPRGADAQEVENRKLEILKLAWAGLPPLIISRKLGVSEGLVRHWMRKAGLPTSEKDAGTFPCPECGGRMQKQELFFWKCDCGAEFWPPENVLPDNPDYWNLPPRLHIEPEAFLLIKQMAEEGAPRDKIAAALNEQGFSTGSAKPTWEAADVSYYTQKYQLRLKESWEEQYHKILIIIKSLSNMGYLNREIADALNTRGYRTKLDTPWDEDAVQAAYARKIKNEAGIRPTRKTRPKLPERMQNKVHPWRVAEDARQAAMKAGRDHALPNMPS